MSIKKIFYSFKKANIKLKFNRSQEFDKRYFIVLKDCIFRKELEGMKGFISDGMKVLKRVQHKKRNPGQGGLHCGKNQRAKAKSEFESLQPELEWFRVKHLVVFADYLRFPKSLCVAFVSVPDKLVMQIASGLRKV